MSIRLSKTCAAKSAAKIDTFFELHNTFPTLFHEKTLYFPGVLPRERLVPLWHYAFGHRPHMFPSTDDEACGVKKNKVVEFTVDIRIIQERKPISTLPDDTPISS